ncbi:SDR family oxidoreductase [Paraburkholderia phenoliruptrix]|uniref:SDR family oxidoreductase n=1 Tax=Paraburkholderia phenoliruptrix TaxID=252970 RepID=UPI002869C431|nr:SDR family oxidoreductase [Paraburkholderia phenoliruptrix]WMY11776.1 SDR family oxidoreductase [Paraburkholderia phenoliruptrix]
MSKLKDTVTIITGASAGIGAATGTKLAELGAKVILVAQNEDKLKERAAQIREAGHSVSYHTADVTDFEQVSSLVQQVQRDHGHVDALVNNAGLMLFSYWKDAAIDDWNRMIDVNLRGYLNCIAAVLPGMLERKSGKIVNMSSVAGIHVGEAAGVYGATKFFIRGITESLRKEVGVGSGIQVSMISPGVIDTGWATKVTDNTGRAIAEKLNAGAIGPDAIADAVAYVLDKPANVTVSDIVVHPTAQDW